MKNNLYLEAGRMNKAVSGLPVNIHLIDVMKSNENTLEIMSQGVFGYEKDGDFFSYIAGTTKRMALGKISKEIENVLKSKNTSNVQLLHLADYTDEVYEQIKKFPTVKKVCGNPDDEAEFISMEENRDMFKNALAHFIARQLFVYKLNFNSIVNSEIREAVKGFVERRDRTKTLHHVSWQTAKTFKDGGLDIKQVTSRIFNVFTEGNKKLQEQARSYGMGYLQKQSDNILQNERQSNSNFNDSYNKYLDDEQEGNSIYQ